MKVPARRNPFRWWQPDLRSPVRLLEIGAALIALALPLAESRWALVLAAIGASFVVLLAVWPSAVARGGIGLAVVGNAWVLQESGPRASVLLGTDAVALAAFLMLGAMAEVGIRWLRDAPAGWWLQQLARVGIVGFIVVVLVLTTWMRPPGSLWLVLVGMAAALAVLVLARRDRTESG